MSRSRIWTWTFALGAWCFALACPGQEISERSLPATDASQVDPAEAEIAFRFSEEFFATLLRRRVDRTMPVRQCILGAWVTGTARTTANVNVVFQPNEKEAQFYIVLAGQTVSHTVGAQRSARVYTTTTTCFRAWKLVRFQGQRFVVSPAGIQAQTWSHTRGVASTARMQFVNRLVRRVAANRANEVRGYTDNLANWRTRRQVLQGFNESVDRAIEEANVRLSIRQTLISRFGGLENLTYRLSTTKNYLEIYVNIASDLDPKRPPIVDHWRQSPMEIWVHTYLEDELLPPILQDWAPRYRFFIERGAGRLAEAITPEEVDFTLQFTPQLDWVVMRFGDELMERVKERVKQRREREGR